MYRAFTHRADRPGRFAAPVLALVLLISPIAHAAGPTPSPTPNAADAAEEAKLNAIFQRFDNKRDGIESSLRSLEKDLIKVEDNLARLRQVLAKSEAELAKRQAELAAAVKRLEDQRALLRDSAAQIYMRGPWSYLNAMLNAEDVGSMVRVEVYSQSVLGDFVRILHEVEAKKLQVEKLYGTVRAHTIELRSQTAAVEAKEAEILQKQQRAFSRRQALINDLVADFGGLGVLKAHGFDVIIKSYSGSSNKITTIIQEAQQGQDVAQRAEFLLRWPVTEHRITSRFGWRIHPIFKYKSFHTGIDIGSDYGAPIVASLPGRVIHVGYMGAFGMVVLIDHGHSISTVYAHLSRALVHTGQIVDVGTEIAEVGCSGWCTGPHIHYEVRLGAQPDNPVYWL